ncbi:FecR family protein [Pseudozobellia thermophila]|uniref:FecR family protein n=1 Tax=Pseudozobellia thermophila TaxID=192903 RepID=A0A1M6PHJ3_9FLAO|nr:FecR domain-containing protein [Pseudozobellia thermophila]SHK07392.1 FecR family protein [Pseudozobellia thermophila]
MRVSKLDVDSAKSLAGEMESPQDRSMFEINLMLDDDSNEIYKDYKMIWENYPEGQPQVNLKRASERLMYSIDKGKKRKWGTHSPFWVRPVLASAAVLLMGASVFLINTKTRVRYSQEVTTAYGEREKVLLSDGSLVYLNADTQLKYPEFFKDGERVVYVDGEAFFEVKKDRERPFLVKTDGLTVKVLGTKFNVNTKGTSKAISLESGKVQVNLEATGDQITLLPKEELIWNKDSGEVLKRSFDLSKTSSWKEGVLILDNVSLLEALPTINRYYGVEFVAGNFPERDMQLNGAFENQSIEDFIETLQYIADVKIVQVAPKKFSISPRHEK